MISNVPWKKSLVIPGCFALVIVLSAYHSIVASPEEPTFEIPSAPSALGGEGEFPLVDPDPSSGSSDTHDLRLKGNVKDGVQLFWDIDPTAENYKVEKRISDSNWIEVGESTSGTYLDTAIEANRKYSYRVVPMYLVGGVPKRGVAYGPRRWREDDHGVLQIRTRHKEKSLYGFASFLPFESDWLFTKSSSQKEVKGDSMVFWFNELGIEKVAGLAKEIKTIDPITAEIESVNSGTISGKRTDISTDGQFLPIHREEGGHMSCWPLFTGNEIKSETSWWEEQVDAWSYAYPDGQWGHSLTRTTYSSKLSGPVDATIAYHAMISELPGWSEGAWTFLLHDSHGYTELFLGPPIYDWYYATGTVTASLIQFQFRLAFSSEPANSSAELFIQQVEIPCDDIRTEEVDESKMPVSFSYPSVTDSSLSFDSENNVWVASENDCPASEMLPNRKYSIERFSVELSVSDYRGPADCEEENADGHFVGDPYQGSTSEEFYVPEPAGPSVFLENPVSAHIVAGFGGGYDGEDWEGELSWSGAPVVVKRSTSKGSEVVSSPLKLGRISKEEFVSGVNLEVSPGSLAAPGAVTFRMTVQDSKGASVAPDQTVKVNLVAGSTPELSGPSQFDSYLIPSVDACGPSYRKVSLFGRPIPDQLPDTKEEADEAIEQTYIDAFSLNLRHSTTDIYVPVPGSDLALTVRRNIEPEIWNFESGLRPHERPDRPFGSGWSSNLGAMIEFVTNNGPDANGLFAPPEVIVTDDEGNSFKFIRFQNEDEDYFFPYPASTLEAKLYLNSLTIEGGKYILRRKYGKTLEFESVSGDQTIACNRAKGSDSATSRHYARLIKVTDRMGYNLRYSYGGPNTLIPKQISAYSGLNQIPGHSIYIRQDDSKRCVTSVWDPSGKRTDYSYRTYQFKQPILKSGPEQKLNLLRTVVAPATSLVTYRYEEGKAGNPFVVEDDPIPRLSEADKVDTFQVNVSQITQGGVPARTYSFEYETDSTRKTKVSLPSFSGYVTQAGSPRFVNRIILPGGGQVSFNSIGSIRLLDNGKLQGARSSSVIDALGNRTDYQFDGIRILALKKFGDLFDPEAAWRSPKLLFYTNMEIVSAAGRESYSFDANSGYSLSRVVDINRNVTKYTYGDTFIPGSDSDLFFDILDNAGFIRYDDPTKVERGQLNPRILSYSDYFRILKQETDENGNSTRFTVDDKGRRTKEEKLDSYNAVKQRTDFLFSSTLWPGFITNQKVFSLSDPSAAAALDLVTDFEPDDRGRVASKTVDPSGEALTASYTYNLSNALVFHASPSGSAGSSDFSYTRFDYDDRQRLIRTTFDDDSYKEFTYDSRGQKILERDENGNITSFGYDVLGRLISQTRKVTGGDIAERYAYNKVGSLVNKIDPNGKTTIRTYDAVQRLTSITEPGKGKIQFSYSGSNSGATVQLPTSFKPTLITDPMGYQTENSYNAYYRLDQSKQSYANGQKRITRFKYDQVGNQTDQYDGLGAHSQTVYDFINRPIEITDPLGRTEKTFYTSTGLKWKVQNRREKDTVTQYDGVGRPTKIFFPEVDAGTSEREMAYDRAGNLTTVIDQRGNVTEYEYNNRNLEILERKPAVFDAEGNSTDNPEIAKAYDYTGNLVDQWDSRGVRTHSEYDEANRATDVLVAYGTASEIQTHTTYDRNGNVLTVRDPRGGTTANVYDDANRLIQTTNSEGISTKFAYDLAGNRTRVTDGKSQTTSFQYDGLNRLTKTTDHTGIAEELIYDAENKIARIDGLRRRTAYFYDKNKQLTSVAYAGSDARSYAYDENGNLLGVDEHEDAKDVSYAYDDLDRVTTEISNGVTHEYTYDLAGNRTGITNDGTGRTLSLAYDALNRLQSIEDGDHLTEYTYTLNGNEASRTYKADGAFVTSKVESTFDELGRLSIRTGFEGSSQISRYSLNYDLNGNVVAVEETYASGLSNRTLTMVYDDANRLTEENITVSGTLTSTTYDYDAADNRTERTVTIGGGPADTATYTYNSLNQLTATSFSGSTPAISYTYDLQGNRISRTQDVNLTSYSYDLDGRLTSVRVGGEAKHINIHPVMSGTLGTPGVATYYLSGSGGGGTLYQYGYDYRTRRVQRVESGTTTNVTFSGGTSVLEMTGEDTASSPTVEFVRGADMGGGVGGLLYSVRSGTYSLSHYNSRGDVTAKLTASGTGAYAMTYQASYEAFGKQTQTVGSTPDRQKANTKEEDPTGLLNEGHRYRDLETGSFLTRDPAGFVDGPNLYAYVRQNPWSAFDPEGLESSEFREQHPILSGVLGVIKGATGAVLGTFGAKPDNDDLATTSSEEYEQSQRSVSNLQGLNGESFNPANAIVTNNGDGTLSFNAEGFGAMAVGYAVGYMAPRFSSLARKNIEEIAAKGPITWVDETVSNANALAYERGAAGWLEGKAPRLSATDSIGTVSAKFDGVQNGVLIDRKLSVTTFPKAQQQALRQSAVAAENGYTVRWEVPTQAEATRATGMFNTLGIKNIQVVVVPGGG